VGLYVHVPYCARRCAYCDFYSSVGRPGAAYVDALLREWTALAAAHGPFPSLATTYLGGGTPGLLPAPELHRLLDGLHARAPLLPGAEVTLEANPRDVSPSVVLAWKRAGVTRVSLGVQSLDDPTLTFLGRDHDAAQAREALHAVAQAGLVSFSADLIFGAPVQAPTALERDLTEVGGLAPHVSAYCLTWSPGTPLHARWLAGGLEPLPGDQEADRQERVRDHLHALGLRQYEVSNHARPGHQAVHNRLYWAGSPTLGLGPGASSYLRWANGTARRWRNAPDLQAYLAGGGRAEDVEDLSPEAALRDRLFCGLRDMEQGVNLPRLEADHGAPVPADAEDGLRAECRTGALEEVGPRHYRVTSAGALFADRVARAVVGQPST
jgi:oxygen-independent coproporphyrinogen-3 oxidase